MAFVWEGNEAMTVFRTFALEHSQMTLGLNLFLSLSQEISFVHKSGVCETVSALVTINYGLGHPQLPVNVDHDPIDWRISMVAAPMR